MRPKEDTVPRPPTGSTMPRPNPVRGSTHAVIEKKINYTGQSNTTSATVRINGEVVEPGQHTADHLAMLGVDEDSVDAAWHQFLIDSTMRPGNAGAWDAYHQDGMGWQIEIDLVQEGKIEYEDLAYVDPRNGARNVTFWCKRWSGVENPTDVTSPPGPGATFEVVSKTESLDAIYAVGFFWSGVSQGEIDSTVRCAAALKAAREALHDALWEIDLALHIANKAWSGPRAEITKHKFAVEREIITPIQQVTHGWETFIHDLVTEQRKAKQHDEDLRKEIAAELSIDVLVGAFTFGAGWIKAGFYLGRLAHRAQEISKLQRALANRYVVTAGQLARSSKLIVARRALAHGAKDLSARAIVNSAQGKSPTDGWVLSFAAAAGVGGGVWWQRRYGVNFGAFTAKHGTEAAAKGSLTDAALASPFMMGIGGELAGDAAKGSALAKKVKRYLAEKWKKDENVIQGELERLRKERLAQGLSAYPHDWGAQVDKAIEDQAEATVDGIIDGAFGGSAKGTARAIDGYREQQQTPSLPSGAVQQPVRR